MRRPAERLNTAKVVATTNSQVRRRPGMAQITSRSAHAKGSSIKYLPGWIADGLDGLSVSYCKGLQECSIINPLRDSTRYIE